MDLEFATIALLQTKMLIIFTWSKPQSNGRDLLSLLSKPLLLIRAVRGLFPIMVVQRGYKQMDSKRHCCILCTGRACLQPTVNAWQKHNRKPSPMIKPTS